MPWIRYPDAHPDDGARRMQLGQKTMKNRTLVTSDHNNGAAFASPAGSCVDQKFHLQPSYPTAKNQPSDPTVPLIIVPLKPSSNHSRPPKLGCVYCTSMGAYPNTVPGTA